MGVPITFFGNNDNVLAQVCTDADIENTYQGSSKNAVEAAYINAGVTKTYFGNRLNEIERLAAAVSVITGDILEAYEGWTEADGRHFVADAIEGPAQASTANFKTAKTFCSFTINSYSIEDEDAFLRLRIASLGDTISLSVEDGLCHLVGFNPDAFDIPLPAPYDEYMPEAGDEIGLWVDPATGQWGLVMPDGGNTGDLSGLTEASASIGWSPLLVVVGGSADVTWNPAGDTLDPPAGCATWVA